MEMLQSQDLDFHNSVFYLIHIDIIVGYNSYADTGGAES